MTDKVEVTPTEADYDLAEAIVHGAQGLGNAAHLIARHRLAAEARAFAAGIEAAAKLIENGRFLTDDSPPKLFANQVVPLIRAIDPASLKEG
jgi:hypothetical protein